MHTIKRQNANEWYVGRIAVNSGQEAFVPLFHGMSISNAVGLCNTLNGGSDLSEAFARTIEYLACK